MRVLTYRVDRVIMGREPDAHVAVVLLGEEALMESPFLPTEQDAHVAGFEGLLEMSSILKQVAGGAP